MIDDDDGPVPNFFRSHPLPLTSTYTSTPQPSANYRHAMLNLSISASRSASALLSRSLSRSAISMAGSSAHVRLLLLELLSSSPPNQDIRDKTLTNLVHLMSRLVPSLVATA